MQDRIRIKYLEDLLRNGTKIELYRFGSDYEDGFACAVTCRNVSCDGQTVVTNRCVLNADTLIDLFREVDKFIFNFSGPTIKTRDLDPEIDDLVSVNFEKSLA